MYICFQYKGPTLVTIISLIYTFAMDISLLTNIEDFFIADEGFISMMKKMGSRLQNEFKIQSEISQDTMRRTNLHI